MAARRDAGARHPRYDPATALLVVDVQNDFADPAGNLSVAGGAGVVPILNSEITAARSAGSFVVYTQDWHPESTPHFAKDGGIWPVHCVMDTWGAAFLPPLVVDGPIVRKGSSGEDGYSGFSVRHPTTGAVGSTELDDLLKRRGIKRLVVGGLTTDYCVRETALDARRLGYEVSVLADAIRAVDLQSGDGDRALADMAEAGVRIERSATA